MLALAKAFDTEGFSCCHTVQELGARLCVLPRLDHGLFGLPEPYKQNTPSLLRHAKAVIIRCSGVSARVCPLSRTAARRAERIIPRHGPGLVPARVLPAWAA